MPTIAAGQIIDSYRIVRQIGAGGMGAVYEATHVVLGQRVAIKILTSDYREQPSLLQRFINEARAASQSNHPGIVKVFDLGQLEDGLPWLSMEYLDGQSLAARIHAAARREGGTLGFGEFWIVGDIASALAAAHAKGIIHRDLKPGNVMIVPDPATLTGERAKVVDFGVAKLHTDQLTKRGSVLGTPLYMALEQFRDSTEVDGKADVFSLGVIAYEILAGRRPHNGQTHYEVMGARMMDPIRPLQQLVPSLPESVAALVMRMLEREPGQRPTMSEVEVDVRRLLGLPPPRQSGWHDAVVMEPTPEAPNIDGAGPAKPAGLPQFDSNASTPDAPAVEAVPSLVATPSAEKALGEISPPSAVPIPISISAMPSVPVPISPGLHTSPEASTARPAPIHFIPDRVASPSSPTVPDKRGGRRWYWLGAVAVMVLAVGGGSLLLGPHRQPEPVPATGVEHPSPPPPAPPQIPPPTTPATSAQLPLTSPTPPPELLVPPDKVRPASRGRCVSRPADASCIVTPMPKPQRAAIAAALKDKDNEGVSLCPGDSMVLTGLPRRPAILVAPPSFKGRAKELFLLTLKGLPTDTGAFPAQVEIQCRK